MKLPRRVGRCHKCGKRPTMIREHHTIVLVFDLDREGRFVDDPDRGQDGGASPAGIVEAYCPCGHIWRLRGVSQITDLESTAAEE